MQVSYCVIINKVCRLAFLPHSWVKEVNDALPARSVLPFPVGSLCPAPQSFFCPGLGFLEEGVYEYRDTHLETKSGQTTLVFISGGLAQQETSHSDTICTINLSGRGYHNHSP